MSEITTPATYSKRDLLLLLQLLHTDNLIAPTSVEAADLSHISQAWFHHKSTQLSRLEGLGVYRALTQDELVELYKALLEQYPGCADTTQLANAVYHERVAELESKLAGSQDEFKQLIDSV